MRHEFSERTVVTTEAVGASTWPDCTASRADTDVLFVAVSAPFHVPGADGEPATLHRLVTSAVIDDVGRQLCCRQRAVAADGRDLPTGMREQAQGRTRIVIGLPTTDPDLAVSPEDVASWFGAHDATVATRPASLRSVETRLGLTRDGLVGTDSCARLAGRALAESDATRRQRLLLAALESARIDLVATIAGHGFERAPREGDDERAPCFDLAS